MGDKRNNRVYQFGGFQLNPQEHLLVHGQETIPLSPRAFALLVKLVENAGHLLDKETLMREVWAGSIVEEGNLNRTISRLRKALGEKPNEDQFIQTIPRVGYRFIAPVKELAEPTANGLLGVATQVKRDADSNAFGPRPDKQRGEKRFRWLPAVLAIGMVVAAASIYAIRRNRQAVAGSTFREALTTGPLRLTDDPADDTNPHWTNGGQIRFFRTHAGHRTASYIMNADGTNQQAVKDFPNLMFGVWSPDGQKVIFAKPNDRDALYLAALDGSNEIALPFAAGNYGWSFDSKQIVYQKTIEPNNVEVFVYSIDTRQSRNISNNPAFDADPSFGPDGLVAFVSSRDGNNEIYVTNTDNRGNARRLTNSPAEDSHPVFSPDGTAIAFTSDRQGETADVYLLVNLDGSDNAIKLTDWNSNETVEPGCWSPDGTKIAFFSDRNGKDDIYVMSAETFHLDAMFSDADRDLGFPSYSPDGKKILFQTEAADKNGELRVFDADTNQMRTIVRLNAADASPAWSPNGEWIAFQNRIDSNTEICIVKADGSALKNLTNNPGKDVSPAWSPDGKQIVFASNREGSTQIFQLFLMHADGTNPHRIYYSNGFSSAPSWSPEGKEIVFANDKEDNRTGNFEIFTIEPETSAAERRLTFRRRYDVSPVFSPDGKRIAFVSQADGNSEIYLMNSDGSALVRLTRNNAEDLAPHWSNDGRKIIFSSNRNGLFAIFSVEL